MNKTIAILSLLIFGVLSCKNSETEFDQVEIAKKYYEVLDQSDASGIKALLTDSLLTQETEYDYEQTFSQQEYIEWLKWDSVFKPTYQILEIRSENGAVEAKISKTDKRINFLHREPIVTKQILRFEEGKIVSIETNKYLIFNDSLFVANREKLLSWIAENHPELDSFIHDQTEAGGKRYLEAIALYESNR